MRTLKLAVLISGRGSNLQAIFNSIEKGGLSAKIECVISNRPDALGLERAKKHHVSAVVIDHKQFSDKKIYEEAVVNEIKKHKVDLICLAGYMRIVGETILKAYKGKIINIHPALLPSFPGLHAQRQAIEAGVKESGCTVHFVDEGCDTGPIIIQKTVPVLDGDTEETLSARILEEEHKLYPQAIQLIAQKKIKLQGRTVILQ